ncbi:hypothetical protein CIB84_001299 [Bambusicola thoracicus]|uniref:Secreted protein n=1 Tax=Bambusicola thoracicus TaxID=9083 RepID=A0A2P4TF35_BAMTH|nr:hypothetical protein CIB84_001299 [Bambusicola thoracicus]
MFWLLAKLFLIVQLQTVMKMLGFHAFERQLCSSAVIVALSLQRVELQKSAVRRSTWRSKVWRETVRRSIRIARNQERAPILESLATGLLTIPSVGLPALGIPAQGDPKGALRSLPTSFLPPRLRQQILQYWLPRGCRLHVVDRRDCILCGRQQPLSPPPAQQSRALRRLRHNRCEEC